MEESESILYDRTTLTTEWETDVSTAEIQNEIDLSRSIYKSITSRFASLLRFVGLSSRTGCNLPLKVIRIISSSSPWQVSLSPCGEYLAVLRRHHLELRMAADNFVTVKVTQMTKDKRCEWRKIFWSHRDWLGNDTGSILAVSISSGKVFFFDINLSVIKRVDPETFSSSTSHFSKSVAAVVFPQVKAKTRSGMRYFCIIHRNGNYSIYRLDAKSNILLINSSVLDTPNGVEDYVWSQRHHMLITAGGQCPGDSVNYKKGLNGWKFREEKGELRELINISSDIDYNFYGRIRTGLSMAIDGSIINGSRIASLSPDESKIALCDLDGTISIWDLPALVPITNSVWPLGEQPDSHEMPPDQKQFRSLNKYFPLDSQTIPFNLSWWTDSIIVLTRLSGAISIYSIADGGLTPVAETEWVNPGSVTTSAINRSLFGVECKIKSSLSKDFFVEDDSDANVVKQCFTFIKGVVYYLTEIEMLKPIEKTAESLNREFSLFQLEQTTPSRMYLRKIDDGEYSDALQVAHDFGLDTDLVYERQWETSNFDKTAIENYLRKITKRSYINVQCLHRIPGTIDNCRELLEFGLRGNNLTVLKELSSTSPDNLGFILDDMDESYIATYGHNITEKHKEELEKKNIQLLSTINLTVLNKSQIAMIRTRFLLLQYLDRLNTYEELNGGYQSDNAIMNFNPDDYDCFREQNIAEYCCDLARKADWKNVEILFVFHQELLPHRLALLSCFPECVDVKEYRILLPEMCPETGEVIPIEGYGPREKDWCEEDNIQNLIGISECGNFLYEYFPYLEPKKYLDLEYVTMWYVKRVKEIERRTGCIRNALSLLQEATDRFVPIDGELERLNVSLEELHDFVYVWGIDRNISIENIRSMCNFTKLEIYIRRFEEFYLASEAVPNTLIILVTKTLELIEAEENGSRLKTIEKVALGTGTWLVVELIERNIICDHSEIMQLTLNLAYSNKAFLTSDIEKLLLKCPKATDNTDLDHFHEKMDKLEDLIAASKIIAKCDVNCDIKDLLLRCEDAEKIKSLFRLIMKKTKEKVDPKDLPKWVTVLQDFHALQNNVFDILSVEDASLIFVEEMLNFGKKEFLLLAQHFVCPSQSFEDEIIYETGDTMSKEFTNLKILSFEKTAEIVFRVSERFMIGATDLEDSYIDIAIHILMTIDVENEGDIMLRHRQKVALLQVMNFFKSKNIRAAPHRLVSDSKSDPLSVIQYALSKKTMDPEDILQLSVLLETLTLRNDLYHLALVIAVNNSLESKHASEALVFCREIMKSEFSSKGGWEACKETADILKSSIDQEELYRFVLNHCSAEFIEESLNKINDLESGNVELPFFIDGIFSAISSTAKTITSLKQLEDEQLNKEESNVPDENSSIEELMKVENQQLIEKRLKTIFDYARKDLADSSKFAVSMLCLCTTKQAYEWIAEHSDDELNVLMICYYLSIVNNMTSEFIESKGVLQTIECSVSAPNASQEFQYYYQKLLDLLYSKELEEFDIDPVEFLNDEQYRLDTIAGLGDTDDSNQLSLAIALSERYDLDKFNILINHIENYINTANLENIVPLEEAILLEVTADKRFDSRLKKYCWHNLNGTDHNRMMLYWSILSRSPNQDTRSSAKTNMLYLTDMRENNCLTFDMKLLLENNFSAIVHDITPANLIDVEKILVKYNDNYEAFSLSVKWLTGILQGPDLHAENQFSKLYPIFDSLPDNRLETFINDVTKINYSRLKHNQLQTSVHLFVNLLELCRQRGVASQDVIERKINVFELFLGSILGRAEDIDRKLWIKTILEGNSMKEILLSYKSDEWYDIVYEISTVSPEDKLCNLVPDLMNGDISSERIDDFLEYSSPDKDEVRRRVTDEVVRLLKTNVVIDLPLFIKLNKELNIVAQLSDDELDVHITRFVLAIKHDYRLDDMRLAKKIQLMSKLLEMVFDHPVASTLQKIIGIYEIILDLMIPDEDRENFVRQLLSNDEHGAKDILLHLINVLDFQTWYGVAFKIEDLIRVDSLTTKVMEDNLSRLGDDFETLQVFISSLLSVNAEYTKLITNQLKNIISSQVKLEKIFLEFILDQFGEALDVENVEPILVQSLIYYKPVFTKEKLLADVDFIKRLLKFAKKKSFEILKMECSWRQNIYKLFGTNLMQRHSRLLSELYLKMNHHESCIDLLVLNREEIGEDFYRCCQAFGKLSDVYHFSKILRPLIQSLLNSIDHNTLSEGLYDLKDYCTEKKVDHVMTSVIKSEIEQNMRVDVKALEIIKEIVPLGKEFENRIFWMQSRNSIKKYVMDQDNFTNDECLADNRPLALQRVLNIIFAPNVDDFCSRFDSCKFLIDSVWADPSLLINLCKAVFSIGALQPRELLLEHKIYPLNIKYTPADIYGIMGCISEKSLQIKFLIYAGQVGKVSDLLDTADELAIDIYETEAYLEQLNSDLMQICADQIEAVNNLSLLKKVVEYMTEVNHNNLQTGLISLRNKGEYDFVNYIAQTRRNPQPFMNNINSIFSAFSWNQDG